MKSKNKEKFNVCAVVQHGRLEYEAFLFALSFRAQNPDFPGRVIFLEPQPSKNWAYDPRIQNPDIRQHLEALDCEIIPFQNDVFGSDYAYSNKILGLSAMPEGEPFVFFDTDTLFTGPLSDVPFDFDCPSASLRRENTWPSVGLYGPSAKEIWKSLYDRFGLDFDSSLDTDWPEEHWRRYLYFNAGYFYYKCPKQFSDVFLKYALEIDRDPPQELADQNLRPWLDQVALPLVIHALGGKRDALPTGLLDGAITCHYRVMSLLYATEPDTTIDYLENLVAHNKIKKVLKLHEPFKKLIYQQKGRKIRPMFDRANLPREEETIRKKIKNRKLWFR